MARRAVGAVPRAAEDPEALRRNRVVHDGAAEREAFGAVWARDRLACARIVDAEARVDALRAVRVWEGPEDRLHQVQLALEV